MKSGLPIPISHTAFALTAVVPLCARAASPIVTGTDAGASSQVKVFDGLTLGEKASFLPYNTFSGGVRVAAGDVNGDGTADVITGAGAGGGPHVKVFSGQTSAEVHSFFAYDAGFSGGVFVAAGDLNGDGRADLVTGAGATSSHVRAFDGHSLAPIHSFLAFGSAAVGVRVAAGDVNGDGRADIVAGSGPGAAHVMVFDGVSLNPIHSFLPYPSFAGGVFVAAGDINGDGRADIITGTDDTTGGGASLVRAFDGVTLAELRSFVPYDGFTGGVRVAAGDVNNDGLADIITGTGVGAAHVRAFNGADNSIIRSFLPYGAFDDGIFVAGETPIPEPIAPALLASAGWALLLRRR